MKEKMIREIIFNCSGWKAIQRAGAMINMHHIFRQNYSDLEQLLKKIHDDINVTKEVNQASFIHLEQYIFNYLASSSALIDLSRKMMDNYKNTELYKIYKLKTKEVFDNGLSNFIRKLRNYQTHYKLAFPYTVRSLEDNTSWDVVFIAHDLLEHPEQGNAQAKEFIRASGEEINVNKTFAEYSRLVDAFYMWLYAKLDEYHKDDIKERNYLVKMANIDIPEFSFNPQGVSVAECENILDDMKMSNL